MRRKKNYGAIDNFRLFAALLIVAIHTAPLASFSPLADFLATYCLGRVAVPFFLMVTGFFVLAPYQRSTGRPLAKRDASRKVWKFLKKTAVLYAAATALYFPVKIYSKQLGNGLGEWLKEIFFDGTFYHLWYLPAVLLGCLLLLGLLQVFRPPVISVIMAVLYLVGLFGDSCYGLASKSHFLKAFYDGIFSISSYTRNGIFFAPVFLWMGVVVANGKIQIPRRRALMGLLLSLAGMLGEGLLGYNLEWHRHNSMYLLLLPVMFFLFVWLLSLNQETLDLARDCSMYIYIVHPLCIILVRGAAGAIKMTEVFVGQSLIHYLTVCVASIALSVFATYGVQFIKEKRMFV